MKIKIFCFLLIGCFLIVAQAPVSQVQAVSEPTIPTALLQFTSQGHVLGFTKNSVYAANSSHAYRVEFVGANPTMPMANQSVSETGQAVPLKQVTYKELWDGITLIYDNSEGAVLRSTYRLEPHADPSLIQLQYNTPANLENNGTLTLSFDTGVMTESAPIAWQDVRGKRQAVDVTFTLIGNNLVGFEVGVYNPSLPLTIDPWLIWNTFLGTVGEDYATSIAVDSNGDIYLAGQSNGVFTSNLAPKRFFTGDGEADAFVVRLDDEGELIWHTYLGALGEDMAMGIAVHGIESIYLTGFSENRWVEDAVSGYGHNGNGEADAFVAKLSSANGALIQHTFLGSDNVDLGNAITVNGSGEAYIAGQSGLTWGTPKRAHFGAGLDAFVAKLNDDGTLNWHTFLGGSSVDIGNAIALDSTGEVYVTGFSYASWGVDPVSGFTREGDAFVAKIAGGNGDLTWHTFLGGNGEDQGAGIAIAGDGVFVTGRSDTAWGNPLEAFEGWEDCFVAKLDTNGTLKWHTFLGGESGDRGYAIAATENAGETTLVVTGSSRNSWGDPVRAHSGHYDAFVAQLDGGGELTWNTFLGGEDRDYGSTVALDASGGIYVAGISYDGWGYFPNDPYIGQFNAFIAKINSNAGLTWHTFLSVRGGTEGLAIAVGANQEIYVTGMSRANWPAAPLRFHTGDGLVDAFVAKLDSNGGLIWHTFLGATGEDVGRAIVLDANGDIYVTGSSETTWENPVNLHNASAESDAFVAKLNGDDGTLGWSTFLGGASKDFGYGIALDSDDWLYIAGQSDADWDTIAAPVRGYTADADSYVARLDREDGSLDWHTFLGGGARDIGSGITEDGNGAVYVVGRSRSAWTEMPVSPHSHTGDGSDDAFVAKLNSGNGEMIWYLFLGGTDTDWGSGITTTPDDEVVVVGRSSQSWGINPVRPHAASVDCFVAKLNRDGDLTWHTFLGGDGVDFGLAIASSLDGSLYVAGQSGGSWGMPILPFNGSYDAFVAKLNIDGALVQNTFLGNQDGDEAYGIALDEDTQQFYVTGRSESIWSLPSGRRWTTAFIAKLKDSYQYIFPVIYR